MSLHKFVEIKDDEDAGSNHRIFDADKRILSAHDMKMNSNLRVHIDSPKKAASDAIIGILAGGVQADPRIDFPEQPWHKSWISVVLWCHCRSRRGTDVGPLSNCRSLLSIEYSLNSINICAITRGQSKGREGFTRTIRGLLLYLIFCVCKLRFSSLSAK